jgi:hypothetical protein
MDTESKVDVQTLAEAVQELRKLREEVQYLRDRQDILDTLALYARALDRHDWDLLWEDVFHADALVDLGVFVGNARELAGFSGQRYQDEFLAHSHAMTNHICEIDGDTAHAETYVTTYLLMKDGQHVRSTHARYIDRLEKRDGKWKIALRRVVRDALTQVDAVGEPKPEGTWDRTDPSYERPLTLPPDRAALIER